MSAGFANGVTVVDAPVRGLPAMHPQWERDADIVVVGSGAAGMAASLAAAQHGRRVLLVTKDFAGGATPLAQGGLAAAVSPDDNTELHERDTLEAGVGLCDPGAVAALTQAAPAEIDRLAALGARLERKALRLEGGHRRRRIVHSGDDATGAEVHRVLQAAVAVSSVEILDRAVALDAIVGDDGAVGGLLAAVIGADGRTLTVGAITARAVVLATGGFGQAFATTTSPAGATGDGLAIAVRAGAVLRDPEFIQFHPTVLWRGEAAGQCPLITEALRGAGAVLLDLAGHPFMTSRHPLGDLAPRDIVSAVMRERIDHGDRHLWLDATSLGRNTVEKGFPTVTAACRRYGIDPVTEPIPVAPGAHYTCGGVWATFDGRTSVPGLYAVGEVASTGVHGANRLASNSVTEALITGRRAGEMLGSVLSDGLQPGVTSAPGRRPAAGAGVSAAGRARLAAAMSRHAGVVRDRDGLEELLRTLETAPEARRADLDTVQATSLHTTSMLVAAAALARAESRGCHRRRDAPGAQARAHHTLARWDGARLRVWTGPTLDAEPGSLAEAGAVTGAGARRGGVS
jgi:L-aspartate oxidase